MNASSSDRPFDVFPASGASGSPWGDPSGQAGQGGGEPDDCQEMVARLYFFLDGELTDDRRSSIQAHLDGCPSCFGAFDFEAELRMVVASRLRTHVPGHLTERIRMSLHATWRDEPGPTAPSPGFRGGTAPGGGPGAGPGEGPGLGSGPGDLLR